uniref:Uncharacterized protein n=1 Tax=Hyaloperonospora arabidopsidis (strain Emoy2) TaxID=559515 RepID=M4BV06_HYAAE
MVLEMRPPRLKGLHILFRHVTIVPLDGPFTTRVSGCHAVPDAPDYSLWVVLLNREATAQWYPV